MLKMVRGSLPTFVNVTLRGKLVCAIGSLLNFNSDVERLTAAPPPPPAPQLGNLKLAMRVFQFELEWMYSWVYQKVQSSTGSIVSAL